MAEQEVGRMSLNLEEGAMSQECRQLWKLEKNESDFPWSFQKKCHLANTLILDSWSPEL